MIKSHCPNVGLMMVSIILTLSQRLFLPQDVMISLYIFIAEPYIDTNTPYNIQYTASPNFINVAGKLLKYRYSFYLQYTDIPQVSVAGKQINCRSNSFCFCSIFYTLEVVSRCSDPQLQVGGNESKHLLK